MLACCKNCLHIITLYTGPKPPSPSIISREKLLVAFAMLWKSNKGNSRSSFSILVKATLSKFNVNFSAVIQYGTEGDSEVIISFADNNCEGLDTYDLYHIFRTEL